MLEQLTLVVAAVELEHNQVQLMAAGGQEKCN